MAGPPPLVTQQEVFDTADQILENGVRPSAKKIRFLLGKSSFTTIHKHLLVWRKDKNQDVLPLPKVEVPECLIAALKRYMRNYGEKAVSETLAAYQELDHECAVIANEAHHNEEQIEQLRGALDAEKARRYFLEGVETELRANLQDEKLKVIEVGEKLKIAEECLNQTSAELNDAKNMMDDQRKLVGAVQAQLELERERTRSLQSEVEQLKDMLASAQCVDK